VRFAASFCTWAASAAGIAELAAEDPGRLEALPAADAAAVVVIAVLGVGTSLAFAACSIAALVV
jgi:hypothetical protein